MPPQHLPRRRDRFPPRDDRTGRSEAHRHVGILWEEEGSSGAVSQEDDEDRGTVRPADAVEKEDGLQSGSLSFLRAGVEPVPDLGGWLARRAGVGRRGACLVGEVRVDFKL